MLITESDRLLIRLPDETDADALYAIYSDPDVMEYIDGSEPITSVDEARNIIARGLAYYQKNNICHWVIEEKNTGTVVGLAGFNLFEETTDYELVIHLNKAYWNKGYATEAGIAVVQYAIQRLDATRIVAAVVPENNASRKILEKIGLSFVAQRLFDDYLLDYYELTTPGGS